MSNALAIAVVTAVIESRIRTLLTDANISGLTLESRMPRGEDPDDGVYLQPYRIAPNSSLRSLDLPTRRPDGSLAQLPRLAIEVDFAVVFVGDPGTYLAERMAGLVLTDFHANPTLTTSEISDYIAGLAADHPLRNADIGDQLERVKLTLIPLSLEDLSRAWGLGNQSWYALTIAYQASVIILDAEVQPTAGLPVLTTGIHVEPTVGPMITDVSPSVVLGATPANVITIEGNNLRGTNTVLRIRDQLVPVPDEAIGTGRIELPLETGLGLAAGAASVEVLHRVELGTPPDPWRVSATSNSRSVLLLPTVSVPAGAVTDSTTAGEIDVRLDVAPLPPPDQDVTLLLDRIGGTPEHVATTRRTIDGGQLLFTLPRPSPGDYLVRLRVDGATTIPEPDGSGRLGEPHVEVPAP